MADWKLAFRAPQKFTYEACEGAVSTVFTGGTTLHITPFKSHANPYDGGTREVTIRASNPHPAHPVSIEVQLTQELRGPGDEHTTTSIKAITLSAGASVSATGKHAFYQQLQGALVGIGCVDRTFVEHAAAIFDELESDQAWAAKLHGEITTALIAEARVTSSAYVDLKSPRTDVLEAVLAAYNAQAIENVTLQDTRVAALPPALSRFPNLKALTFVEQGIDGDALRGVALPKVTALTIYSTSIRHLRRLDLAGFPKLAELYLQDSQLEELDPDIIEVCPNLRSVCVRRTPFARKKTAAALRERWRGVTWI